MDDESPERLIADLERLAGGACRKCRTAVCGHEALLGVMMGFKDAPVCAACLSRTLEIGRDALTDELRRRAAARACFGAGWRWADAREPGGACPRLGGHASPETPMTAEPPRHDAEWDGGDLGCGDLVLDLRLKLQELKPGQVLRLNARDPGAPEDLPSWCRLTGNTLVAAKHPTYWIRRKES